MGQNNQKHLFKSFLNTFIICCLVTGAAITYANSSHQTLYQRGSINDYAQVIADKDKQQMSTWITSLKNKVLVEVTVVTIKTTAPSAIDVFTTDLLEQLNPKQRTKDSHVLIVIALEDRQAWITRGYRLDWAMPNTLCEKIVKKVMMPFFKQEQYSQGITEGVRAVISTLAMEHGIAIKGLDVKYYPELKNSMLTTRTWIFIGLGFLLLLTVFKKGSHVSNQGSSGGGRW